MFRYIAAAGIVAMTTSCGVSNRHDDVEALKEDREEWTADQTNQAIDIYIEGLNEMAGMYEDVVRITEKNMLEYQLDYKGKKSVRKERKDDLKEAQKALKEKNKELREKYEEDD